MLEDLEKIIDFIISKYEKIMAKWIANENFLSINTKKILVKDIYKDSEVLNAILNYRTFMNEQNLYLSLKIQELNLVSTVNTRVKAKNSIEFKINNYILKHNLGEIPISKCFNDLYGIRIILKENLSCEDIINFISQKYPSLKCINSSKPEGYIAVHVYFKNSNQTFQWELQIWNEANEKINMESHEKYKQDYTKWEKENRR